MLLAPAKVFRPPVYHKLRKDEVAQFFLAGPIQDAYDWQKEWIQLMQYRLGPNCVIFSPRNVDRMPTYDRQVAWERAHIRQVLESKRGYMIFWMPRSLELTDEELEEMQKTRERPRPYAQTTRIEFGETCGLMRAGRVKADVLLGIEPGFPNERYITKLWQELGNKEIFRTLREMASAICASDAERL